MKIPRRSFLSQVAGAAISIPGIISARPFALGVIGRGDREIKVAEIAYAFEEHAYRAPYKFGGRVVDRVTILNVTCRVRTRTGRTAQGFGSMTLGNIWAFPAKSMSYETTLGAMKTLAARINQLTGNHAEYGHPLDLNHQLEPLYLKAADELSKELKLAAPIPKLCLQVTASAFDAALHDAFGKVHNRNCYLTYGADLMTHDLGFYLGPDFKGEYLDRYILAQPIPRVFVYHSVGALDPLEAQEVTHPINDGLPETLPEWIHYNGITHVKIKLNGEDKDWDVERVLRIDQVLTETQKRRGVKSWKYLLDFNENCPNVAHLLEVLRRIKVASPAGFNRIQYIEQPTARDLKANRANVMHEAARLRPVVIDESLTDRESLLLAREMGYTGVALKACKGQSHAMLMAAAAQKYKMFLCVQDLTCPGASLIHSASIASHVPGVATIEANARQYVPAANRGWEERFPGIFRIKDGTMDTRQLNQPGLGAVPPALV